MIYDFINSFLFSIEDKKHPLLGPNIKGLKAVGFINKDRAIVRYIWVAANIFSALFVSSLFIQLAVIDQTLDNFLFNFSVAAVSIVTIIKIVSFILYQSHWLQLFENISEKEIKMQPQDSEKILKHIFFYRMYGRSLTFLYSCLVALTGFGMILSTPLKILMDYSEIRNGNKPYPEMVSSWMPFDEQTVGGCIVASCIRSAIIFRGSAMIAIFDSTCVAIMSFLKGYTKILSEKCKMLFGDGNELISEREVWRRIADCHRHHNFIVKQYSLLNFLLSPVMFLYFLVCSMSICCSVFQLSMAEVSMSRKLYVAEYTIALAFQLFLYCWHGNEITVEIEKVDRAIFESNWWKANARTRKLLILLDGKLSKSLVLEAGPFTTLSITSFITIMKGSYSFYTLFNQNEDV